MLFAVAEAVGCKFSFESDSDSDDENAAQVSTVLLQKKHNEAMERLPADLRTFLQAAAPVPEPEPSTRNAKFKAAAAPAHASRGGASVGAGSGGGEGMVMTRWTRETLRPLMLVIKFSTQPPTGSCR